MKKVVLNLHKHFQILIIKEHYWPSIDFRLKVLLIYTKGHFEDKEYRHK